MQRDDERAQAGQQRRPRDEPEVDVDDVEALPAVAPPQLERGARVVARAGGEGEQLDLDVTAPPQRLDLVAHERP